MEHRELINKLSKKGVKSEVFHSKDESTSISFENSVFKKIESKSITGTGLRVIKDKKIGFSYAGGNLLNNISEYAIENAAFGKEVDFDFPNFKTKPVGSLYSKEVADLPVDELKKTGQEVIDILNRELKGYKFDAGIEKERACVEINNSSGFSGSFKKSYYSVYFSAMKSKDDEIFSTYDGQTTLDLKNGYKEKLNNLITLCKKLETKSKISSGKYPVIFSPKAAGLIFNILNFALNGKNVQKGSSALSSEKGKKIFSENLTIKDNPRLEGGISSVPFDGEGMPSMDKYLIKNGVVENFIADILTAKNLKQEPTANGRRGYSSIPWPGFYNVIVEPGKQSFDEVIKNVKNGVYVDEFIGGGQSNVLAGEFSVNLTLAFKIENGEIKGSLKDTMLSGNVFKILKDSPVFCDELHRKNNYYLPFTLFRGLNISA